MRIAELSARPGRLPGHSAGAAHRLRIRSHRRWQDCDPWRLRHQLQSAQRLRHHGRPLHQSAGGLQPRAALRDHRRFPECRRHHFAKQFQPRAQSEQSAAARLQREPGNSAEYRLQYGRRCRLCRQLRPPHRSDHRHQRPALRNALPGLQPRSDQWEPPYTDDYLRPYQGYGSIKWLQFDGNSSYHSLQMQVRRRFSHGLQFGASWTWSKAMAYSDGDQGTVSTFASRRVYDYGLATYDRTHVLAINYLLDLPKLSKVINHAFVKSVFDGWQMSGITRFVSGTPLSLGTLGTGNLESSLDITGGGDGW